LKNITKKSKKVDERFAFLANPKKTNKELSIDEQLDAQIEKILKEMGILVSSKSEEAKRQEQEKDQEQSNLKPATPRKVPTGITTCPRCSKNFDPDEVTHYTDFGVRCPHCSQSIVL